MRLKKIKLVGFKSFVDPTSVYFPSQLVAVVGPNGCGKSNTIDAVRWVMGESSAKNLRGESMTDVIFNGSLNRKPVGQASVELIFDNDAGRLIGEYAAYNEISIKRIVTRDSQSTYYLNGTKCRKKDVTDLFLGTGLGPRSYSIIGQGTISRVIEAKPDELRIFLEEAAGISKYKERRRETENRIRHTRENLERVQDIRDELGNQIERLHRQAKAAERFKELKQQERLVKAQWHALKWNDFNKQLINKEKLLGDATVNKEQYQTTMNQFEIKIDSLRQEYTHQNDNFQVVQGNYYQVGGEIARLEENIQHKKLRQAQYESDLSEAKGDWQTATSMLNQDQQTVDSLSSEVEVLLPQIEQFSDEIVEVQQNVYLTREKRQQWQQSWEDFNANAHESSKQAHVEQANIQHYEQKIQSLQTTIDKFNQEKETLDVVPIQQFIDQYNEEKLVLTDKKESIEDQKSNNSDAIEQVRKQLSEINALWQSAREKVHSLQAEITSLETLQQAALGKQDSQVIDWLISNQINDNARLAQTVTVESGWEMALEMVLAADLQAVCVDDCMALSPILSSFNLGTITFIDNHSKVITSISTTDKPYLIEKVVNATSNACHHLQGIYAATSIDQAMIWLPQLSSTESIVTQDGVWLGHGWMRVKRGDSEDQSVLFRQQKLQHNLQQLEQDLLLVDEYQQNIENAQSSLEHQEQLREDLSQASSNLSSELADINAKLRVKKAQLEQMNNRILTIEEDRDQQHGEIQETQENLLITRQRWQTAMQAMEGDALRRAELTVQRDSVNQELDNLQTTQQELRDNYHDKELQLKTKQSQLNQLRQNIERESMRIESLNARIEQITAALYEQNNPDDNAGELLQQKLDQHIELEQALIVAKQKLESINESIKEVESSKQESDEGLSSVLTEINQIAIDAQTLKVRCSTVLESLEGGEYALEELLEQLPEHATETSWQEQLQSFGQKIQRLGAINLAAIDEYKTESERKNLIDEQFEDLEQALLTLESAIKKIDKETRSRFKETFDRVNDGFKMLFPRLFGGGDAYLALNGEDLLDTGVTVMARPPGKRNSSIYLLSGGEKAMAAVALIFSIFLLNPAPFCMLDEVDAPLDDANVTRFCAMVKEMSETVQFIFITHNKVTMELADHLSGVTMNEPGVSRIVSVDVEEAIAFSEVDETTV